MRIEPPRSTERQGRHRDSPRSISAIRRYRAVRRRRDQSSRRRRLAGRRRPRPSSPPSFSSTRFTSISTSAKLRCCRSRRTSPRPGRVRTTDLSDYPGRNRTAGRGGLSAQGPPRLCVAAGRPVHRHARGARAVRKQGPGAAAGYFARVRVPIARDKESLTPDVAIGESGRQLCPGARAGQRRPAEAREARPARRPLPRHRLRT